MHDPLDQLQHLLRTLGPGPRVVRLEGPAARDLAARWAFERHILPTIQTPGLPTGPAAIWLDDAPAARITADLWIAAATLHGWDLDVVLTGRARDGGHPGIGTTLSVDTSPAGSTHPPTRLHIEPTPDDAVAALEAADLGDVARAHALWERLADDDPTRAAPLDWIDLLRLRTTGRAAGVDSRATELPHAATCRAEVLVQMASARYGLRAFERAARFAETAIHVAGDESTRSDAAYLFDRSRAALGLPLEGIEPATTWWRANALRLRAHEDPDERAAFSELAGRYAALALEELDTPAIDPDHLLILGHLAHAFRVQANVHGSTPGSALYEQDGGLRQVMDWTVEALQEADVEAAHRHLESVQAELQDHGGFYGTLWLLLWGRCAAAIDDVPGVLFAVAGLQVRSHSVGPSVIELGLPDGEPLRSVWCTTTWLRGVQEAFPRTAATIDARLSALPELPIALGPYALNAPIASGSSGTVWRGRHVLTDTPVAVKVLDDRPEEDRQAFLREASIVAGFSHPAIVTVLDLLEVDRATHLQSGRFDVGRPAIVMEHLDGGTLTDEQGELPWPELRAVLLALLDALSYAHAHAVLHRDLKPANVLLTTDGSLRLSDFGVSALDEHRIVGTPAYMAPEQFLGADLGPPADLYALGCLAWSLATGIPPYLGRAEQLRTAHLHAPLPTLDPVHPQPSGLVTWLTRCLAKAPADRFPTAAAAARALRAIPVPDNAGSRFRPVDPTTSWRPHIPTENLLHHGDPPILGQEDALDALWDLLLQVHRTRRGACVRLVGPPGHGRTMVLRRLWRRAQQEGLQPERAPCPEELSLVVATGPPPAGWQDQPWLLVWDEMGPEHAEVVALVRLDAALTWWALHARIRLAPELAARAAVEALGTPSAALRLVEDWLEVPGARMERRGLVLHRRPLQPGRRAVEWWRRASETWTPELRELARLVSISRPRSRGTDLRTAARATGASDALDRVAIGVNDAWRMPLELQEVFRERAGREEHELLSATTEVPVDRLLHALQAEPTPERTVEVARTLARRLDKIGPQSARILQLHLDLHLLREPHARRYCRVALEPPGTLSQLARRNDELGDLALIRLVHGSRPEGIRDRIVERLEASKSLPVRVWLGVHLATTSLLQGNPASARDAVEGVLAELEPDHPDHALHHDLLLWARCNTCYGSTSAREVLQETLAVVNDLQVRRLLHSDLAHHQLEAREWSNALTSLEGARGGWSIIPEYNRIVARIGEGAHEVAAATTQRIIATAVAQRAHRTLPGLIAVLLTHHLDRPGPVWDRLYGLGGPLEDRVLATLLLEQLAQRPSSSRSERLVPWLA